MNEIAQEFVYPIIWVGEKDVRVSFDIEHFRTLDRTFFKAGHRKRGIVVDSTLSCWDVLSTQIDGYAPPLWGFRLPGTRHYIVKYNWSANPPRKISLEELKKTILSAKRKSGMYVGMAGSPKSYEAMIQQLDDFASIANYFRRPQKKSALGKLWVGPFDD